MNVDRVPVDGTKLGVMRASDFGWSLCNEIKRVADERQLESGRWQRGPMSVHTHTCVVQARLSLTVW